MDEMDELTEEQKESIRMAEIRDEINARKLNTKKEKEEIEEKERKENESKDRRLAEGVARRSRLRNHLITVKLLRKEKIEVAIRKEKCEKNMERKRKKEEKARRKDQLKSMDPKSGILGTISDGDDSSENSDSTSVYFGEENDEKTEMDEETEECRKKSDTNKMFNEEKFQRNFEDRKRENSLMGKEDVQSFIREISDFRKNDGTEIKKARFQDAVDPPPRLVTGKAKKEKRNKIKNHDNIFGIEVQTDGRQFENIFKTSNGNGDGKSGMLNNNNNRSDNNNNNNNDCIDLGPEFPRMYSVRLPLLHSPRNSVSAPGSLITSKNKSEKNGFQLVTNKTKMLEKLWKKGNSMMTENEEYQRDTGESNDDINRTENIFSRSLELKQINSSNQRKNKYDDNGIRKINNSDFMNCYEKRNLFSREMKEEKEKNTFRKTMQKFSNASHGVSTDEFCKTINQESCNTLHNSDNNRLKKEIVKNIIKNQVEKSDFYSDEIAEKIDLIYQKNKLNLLSSRRVLSLASLSAIKPDNILEISPKKEKLLQIEKQIKKKNSINSSNRKKLPSNQILLFDNGVQNYYAKEFSEIGSADEGKHCI
jgi:hypothetical protein